MTITTELLQEWAKLAEAAQTAQFALSRAAVYQERIARLEGALRQARESLSRMYGIVSGKYRVFPNNWTLQAKQALDAIDACLGEEK